MKAYLLAIQQFLSDLRLLKLMVVCVFLSLVLFGLLMGAVGWGLQLLAYKSPWAQNVLAWGGWIGAFVVTLFLFPTLFGVIGGFFYEKVADAVDARHYRHLPAANGPALAASLWSGVQYFILMLVLNCLALPAYLALMWLAGTGLGLFVLVNGVLFGREHFDAVALRRQAPAAAAAWRKANRWPLLLNGMLTALVALVPGVNLIAPLLGVAAMTHVVNSRFLKPSAPPAPHA